MPIRETSCWGRQNQKEISRPCARKFEFFFSNFLIIQNVEFYFFYRSIRLSYFAFFWFTQNTIIFFSFVIVVCERTSSFVVIHTYMAAVVLYTCIQLDEYYVRNLYVCGVCVCVLVFRWIGPSFVRIAAAATLSSQIIRFVCWPGLLLFSYYSSYDCVLERTTLVCCMSDIFSIYCLAHIRDACPVSMYSVSARFYIGTQSLRAVLLCVSLCLCVWLNHTITVVHHALDG